MASDSVPLSDAMLFSRSSPPDQAHGLRSCVYIQSQHYLLTIGAYMNNELVEAKNVAWLIEFFAAILGTSRSNIELMYDGTSSPIKHPEDKDYLPEAVKGHRTKSDSLWRYEEAAKNSARLKAYQKANGIQTSKIDDLGP